MPAAADEICEVIITAPTRTGWWSSPVGSWATSSAPPGTTSSPSAPSTAGKGRSMTRPRAELPSAPGAACSHRSSSVPSRSTPMRCPASSRFRSSTAAPTTWAGFSTRPNSRPEAGRRGTALLDQHGKVFHASCGGPRHKAALEGPMPFITGRSAIRLTTLILLVLLVGGCGGDSASPTAAPTTATTAAPTTTSIPLLGAKEVAGSRGSRPCAPRLRSPSKPGAAGR
jgi:hypothetical protein